MCRVLEQHRSTQRKIPQGREDEARLSADIIELARQYRRYGYRRIAELLRQAGWLMNDKRVERMRGPEFAAKAVQEWIHGVRASTACIAPGRPWENGYIESFNPRMRDELLDGEIFYTLREARTVIESWRRHFNGVRPHSSIGYQAPAPETTVFLPPAWPAPLVGAAPPARLPPVQRPTLH